MRMLPIKPLTLIVALVLGLIAGGAATAASKERIADEVRTRITTQLSAEGYDVRKIEREDGMIEVYALKGGHRYEIYLDHDLNINRIKQDN